MSAVDNYRMIRDLQRMRKACKKDKDLENHMNDYAKEVSDEYGKSFHSAQLLLAEWKRYTNEVKDPEGI